MTMKNLLKNMFLPGQNIAFEFTKNTGLTTKKMKCSIKDFFSKPDQIRSFLQIWSHLLKKSFMEYFISCAGTYQDAIAHLISTESGKVKDSKNYLVNNFNAFYS